MHAYITILENIKFQHKYTVFLFLVQIAVLFAGILQKHFQY